MNSVHFRSSFVLPVGIVALAVVASPATGSAVFPVSPVAAPQTAVPSFAEMEEGLLAMESLDLRVRVVSEGAFESLLEGTVSLRPGNAVTIEAAGSFGGPVELRLSSDGKRLSGGNARDHFDQETPEALHESLIIGLTRMGILHNLAQLVSGLPPDHMEGGVREWVRAVDVRPTAEIAEDGRALIRYDFGLVVSGQRSGTVRLWFDALSRLPLRREQAVQFEAGEMTVIETYEFGR